MGIIRSSLGGQDAIIEFKVYDEVFERVPYGCGALCGSERV